MAASCDRASYSFHNRFYYMSSYAQGVYTRAIAGRMQTLCSNKTGCLVLRGMALSLIGAGLGDSGCSPEQPFEAMSIRDLKQWLAARGVDISDACEKADLVAKAKAESQR
jgi:hypothetical protein